MSEEVDHDPAGDRYALVRPIGAECVQDDELRLLLKHKKTPIVYDGFEPSGRMHIAQALLRCVNTNKLLDAGCHMKLWIADWFAKMNNKCGGDLDKIRVLGRYFIEIWRASSMRVDEVEFIWASEAILNKPGEYFEMVIDIAQRNNLTRIKKCGQIMGRKSGSDSKLTAAQIMYPCMQCTDIFFLNVDICQLGVDQRKVNMLAREYAKDTNRTPPVILSHGMIMSLKGPKKKMSKSDPSTAIYVEDTVEEVRLKINKAYCPDKVYKLDTKTNERYMDNPIFVYIDKIIMPYTQSPFTVGEHVFGEIEDLIEAYENRAFTARDIKEALASAINDVLEPIREHFRQGEAQALLNEVHAITMEL